MNKETETKGRFIQLPSSLLVVLSDTALRILLYAIDKQGLVTLGKLDKWKLTPTDVSGLFGLKFKGYSINTVKLGFRELRQLNLITYHDNNHYTLNAAELETYYKRGGSTKNMQGGEVAQNLCGGGEQNLCGGVAQNLHPNIIQEKEYKKENTRNESFESLKSLEMEFQEEAKTITPTLVPVGIPSTVHAPSRPKTMKKGMSFNEALRIPELRNEFKTMLDGSRVTDKERESMGFHEINRVESTRAESIKNQFITKHNLQ